MKTRHLITIFTLLGGLSLATMSNALHHSHAKTINNLKIMRSSTPTIEKLLGVTYLQNGLRFQVNTGGCTSKDSFIFNVTQKNEPIAHSTKPAFRTKYDIEMRRVVEDYCELYAPLGTEIFVTYEELGISPAMEFVIKNPIGGYVPFGR